MQPLFTFRLVPVFFFAQREGKVSFCRLRSTFFSPLDLLLLRETSIS